MGERAHLLPTTGGRRPCTGHIEVVRVEVPSSIRWRCNSCGDEGVISGWEATPFDLTRSAHRRDGVGSPVRLVITSDTAAILRDVLLLDAAIERLVFQARMDAADGPRPWNRVRPSPASNSAQAADAEDI